MHYLTQETCTLQQAHYAVLFPMIQAWEEGFWREDDPAHRIASMEARLDFSLQLFHRLSFIADGTLRELHRLELAALNPMLGWNPALAPTHMAQQASQTLLEKLTADPELLYQDRPLLREDLQQALRQHTRTLQQMLHRLLQDSEAISEAFFGGRPLGLLLHASADHADAHLDGQHACVLRHEGGSLVYKPRSLAPDCILHHMTRSLFADVMVIPAAVDRGSYGWVQYVHSAPATGEAGAERFFRGMGGVAAVVQAFGSTDLHMQNVLCVDGLPALVDVQTFLSARPEDAFAQTRTLLLSPSDDGFRADFDRSVYSSGLLPRLMGDDEFSPLLHRGKSSVLPLVNGVQVDVLAYQQAFLQGFRQIYDRCQANRDALLADVARLAPCRFRILLRNTNDYARLLQTMYAPRHLASHEAREQLFDRLRQISMQLPPDTDPRAAQVMQAIMEADIRAYRLGDVPFYQLQGDGHGLYAGTEQVAEHIVTESPAEAARTRIRRLCPAEREFEAAMLREALRCAHIRTDDPAEAPTALPITADSLRDAADSLLRQLEARRITSPGGAIGWLDHTADTDSFGAMELMSGMGYAGLGIFAAQHFSVTADPGARRMAQQVMEKLERRLAALRDAHALEYTPGLLGMLNAGGILRFAMLFSAHISRPRGLAAAAELVRLLATVDLSTVTDVDLYNGMSGLLYALCADDQLLSLPHSRDLMQRLALRLMELRTLQSRQGILTWDTLGKHRPISGLGHGVAGVGLALAAAWKVTGMASLHEAACSAFQLEHQLYEPRYRTWPDYRLSTVAGGYVHGICSGAPGMALALLKLHDMGITDYAQDLQRALDFVMQTPPLERDHYCCGNSAVIECLLQAGRSLGEAQYLQEAQARTALLLQGVRTHGQPRFMASGFRNYSPLGQLNGICGVGHVLLRQLRPDLGSLYV